MKERTKHHEFLKQFKDKNALIDYLAVHTPKAEKKPYGVPGLCCGWCGRPISSDIKVGENTYAVLCNNCFEFGSAWNKEKGLEY